MELVYVDIGVFGKKVRGKNVQGKIKVAIPTAVNLARTNIFS